MKNIISILIILFAQTIIGQQDYAMTDPSSSYDLKESSDIRYETHSLDEKNLKSFLSNSLIKDLLLVSNHQEQKGSEWRKKFYTNKDHSAEILLNPKGDIVYAKEKINNYALPLAMRNQILRSHEGYSITEVKCIIIYSKRDGLKKQFRILLTGDKQKKRVKISLSDE